MLFGREAEWRECCHPQRYDIDESTVLSIDCISDETRAYIASSTLASVLGSVLPVNYRDNGCPLGNHQQ